jgi:hypothetical protein
MGGTNVRPQSLDGSANALLELAALLQAGRPEPAISGRVRAPVAHEEVATRTREFAEDAHNQYEDAVALTAALAMKLKTASSSYTSMDAAVKQHLDSFLNNSTYVGP